GRVAPTALSSAGRVARTALSSAGLSSTELSSAGRIARIAPPYGAPGQTRLPEGDPPAVRLEWELEHHRHGGRRRMLEDVWHQASSPMSAGPASGPAGRRGLPAWSKLRDSRSCPPRWALVAR